MEQLQIIKCENPFNKKSSIKEVKPFYYGTTVLDIYCQEIPSAAEVTISINGKVVPTNEWDKTFLKKNDEILIVPNVEGSGRQTAGMILMIIVAIVAIAVSQGAASGLVAGYFAAGSASAAYLALGIMVVGGLLVNAMVDSEPTEKPNESASVYSWNPSTTNVQGGAIPFCYGLHKIHGNIITGFLDNNGEDNYTNILLSLGMGPINRIYDFKINDQLMKEEVNGAATTNFDGTTIEVRHGTVNQTVIANFNDTKVEFMPSHELTYGTYVTHTTINNNFDGLEVDITCPNGLYDVKENGEYFAVLVDVTIEIKKQGDSAWTYLTSHDLYTEVITDGELARWSLGGWYNGDQLQGWWELHTGTTNPTDHTEGEITVETYLGITYTHLVWRWIVGRNYSVVSQIPGYYKFSGRSSTAISKTFKSLTNLSHGIYDIRVTRLNANVCNDRISDKVYLAIVREVYTDDFAYPRNALVGIKSLANENISGSLQFSCLMEARLIRVYNSSTLTWSIIYSNNPAWVCYDILTQPVYYDFWEKSKTYTVGSIVRATSLNGKLYQVTVAGISGATEPVWPTTIGQTKVDNTVTWTCIAGATVDGVNRFDGYNPSYLDLTSFSEWADWCDTLVDDGAGATEKRIIFNGIFDASNESVWDAAISIGNVGRACLLWSGNSIKVIIDKAATEVQLFTVGNIGLNSFKETFLSVEDRAGEIEIQFTNAANDYNMDTYTYINPDAGNVGNKAAISLVGCTSPSEAWRAAKYRSLCNQYLLRTIEFDVDVDAIACTLGDVIRIQHDIPQWGYGGRVVSATSNSVTLDQTVTIAAGSSYEIVVRLSDDTVVEKVVTNLPGDTTVITVSTPFSSIPVQFDVFAFGLVNVSYKPFRVVSMKRKTDLTATIQAVEYNANVYTVDTGSPVLPTPDYSQLSPFVNILTLALVSDISIDFSDALHIKITAVWTVGVNTVYRRGKVYIRELLSTGLYSSWSFAGETSSLRYEIVYGLKLNNTYQVAVTGVNFIGVETPFTGAFISSITIGDSLPNYPSGKRITGLRIFGAPNTNTFNGKDCKFQWNSLAMVSSTDNAGGTAGNTTTNSWLKDYQIKIYTSAGALKRTEYVVENWYTYTFDKNYEDNSGVPMSSFTIGVAGRSRAGDISEETKLNVSNTAPTVVTNLSATSVVGGVLFLWDKKTDEDIQCYYVRTKVDSTGTFSSWSRVTDNSYTRMLTDTEITDHGINAVIYIEVQAMDLFNQVSTSATINEEATTISDNIFQLVGTKSGGTGNVSDLYDGTRSSGGVII